MGVGAQVIPQRRSEAESLDEKTSAAPAGQGEDLKLVLTLRAIDATNSEVIEKIRIESNYFERNAERMRHPGFRRQHLFAGSSVIEAGCKTVAGSRLKRSDMFWTVRGPNAIVALRCCHLIRQFGDYWEDRRAA